MCFTIEIPEPNYYDCTNYNYTVNGIAKDFLADLVTCYSEEQVLIKWEEE